MREHRPSRLSYLATHAELYYASIDMNVELLLAQLKTAFAKKNFRVVKLPHIY